MPSTIALVPLRSPGRGKTRLAGALTADQRAALVNAMFIDVTSVLREACVDRIVVAAGGPEAISVATLAGLEFIPDQPSVTGLDAAVANAADRLGPRADLLIVVADLPALTTVEIERLLAADGRIVVAPTRHDGTGGLLQRSSSRIPTAYGIGSARRHRALALEAGVSFGLVRSSGFHHDVDTPDDLAGIRGGPLGTATAALLDDWAGAPPPVASDTPASDAEVSTDAHP